LPHALPCPDASVLVFTVNSQGDDADLDPLENLCWSDASVVTSQGSELECTICATIEHANAFADADTVEFGADLPQTADTTTFSPDSPLPPITDSLMIRDSCGRRLGHRRQFSHAVAQRAVVYCEFTRCFMTAR
jgi:hypothetical protein